MHDAVRQRIGAVDVLDLDDGTAIALDLLGGFITGPVQDVACRGQGERRVLVVGDGAGDAIERRVDQVADAVLSFGLDLRCSTAVNLAHTGAGHRVQPAGVAIGAVGGADGHGFTR